MKIVFIISSLASGGAERVCAILSGYLADKGYDVTILMKPNAGEVYYELSDNVKVQRLNYKRKGGKSENIFQLIRNGILLFSSLYKTVKQQNPDIIISLGTDISGLAILASKLQRRNIIVSDHTSYKLTSFTRRFIRRFLYRWATTVTLLTNYDKENYYDKFLNNTVVIPNPTSFCDVDNIASVRQNAILCVGNLNKSYIKGFDRMLLIYKSIYDKHPDWKLWIAGGGDNSQLKNQVASLQIEGGVKFLGLVKDMKELYSKSSLFALSSRNEGMPMVLLEAMSCGCACVSFDIVTGPSEMIDDSINGYLVKDNDPDMFRDRILELIGSKEKREQMSKNAKIKSKDFSIDIIGQKWIDLINKIGIKS